MGFTALHILLWLLTAFTLTTQELVELNVSPQITAECGKKVTINCNVSSSLSQLSIIHMRWLLNNTSLCSVDSKGNITHRHNHALSDFHCEYKQGQLSLIFQKVQPLDIGDYKCKLKSNQGLPQKTTRVELQECCGIVEGVWDSDGPACTFKHVYPDGDVHWFHSSHSRSDGSLRHSTTKQMDKGGWLTIRSDLEQKSSDVQYNCSLKCTKPGRYIVSTLVQNEFLKRGRPRAQGPTKLVMNGVGSQRTMRTFLCISILLVVTLI